MLVKSAELLSLLVSGDKRVAFVWVPGHVMIEGNELADRAAGRAAGLNQGGKECLKSSVRFCLKSMMNRRVWSHVRCREVYGQGLPGAGEDDWSRSDVVSMGRLRSGHSLELGAYRTRIGMSVDASCRRCGLYDETVEHVWQCDAGEGKRRVLGLSGRLYDLCLQPKEALEYWRWWRRTRPRWE